MYAKGAALSARQSGLVQHEERTPLFGGEMLSDRHVQQRHYPYVTARRR